MPQVPAIAGTTRDPSSRAPRPAARDRHERSDRAIAQRPADGRHRDCGVGVRRNDEQLRRVRVSGDAIERRFENARHRELGVRKHVDCVLGGPPDTRFSFYHSGSLRSEAAAGGSKVRLRARSIVRPGCALVSGSRASLSFAPPKLGVLAFTSVVLQWIGVRRAQPTCRLDAPVVETHREHCSPGRASWMETQATWSIGGIPTPTFSRRTCGRAPWATAHRAPSRSKGSDGSWLILDLNGGSVHGVEVAVWPEVRKRSAARPAERSDRWPRDGRRVRQRHCGDRDEHRHGSRGG